ncbi:MAG: aspartate/glutamate racemase family protein [Clostridia bacterium]|nr:aspartate/glutamate racemase family protein [Clostridia bacterium]
MIGLIDSGEGGIITAREIRRLNETLDLTLLLDRRNAPYGTKSESELTELTGNNIERLLSLGASRVLIACCTASTVWNNLPEGQKKVSVPILSPTARRAESVTKNGRIAVIATAATVRSGAWSRLLFPLRTTELALGELVTLVESGARDGKITDTERKNLEKLLSPLSGSGADTLILGCTHFPALEREIKEIVKKYGIRYTVSSAREGARELIRTLTDTSGHGRTVLI